MLQTFKRSFKMEGAPPLVRRIIIGVVGGTVILIGIALIVLPGPAFIVIPIGLAILATQFAWARHYLNKGRKAMDAVKTKLTRNKTSGS